MTAALVAVLGGVALGAAGTAVARGGRAATLVAFGAAQLAVGLALVAAGLWIAGIAELLLGGVGQLLLLSPLGQPARAAVPGTRWVRSAPAAVVAVAGLALVIGLGVSAGSAWVHRPGPGPSAGRTLLLGYAIPVLLAVILAAAVAGIGVTIATRDRREIAETAAALAHRRRAATQRERAIQRAAARAGRRGDRS